jgi:hypothetical protein
MSDTTKKGVGKWINDNVAPLVTLLTLIGLVFGGYLFFESRYVKAEDLHKLETKFAQLDCRLDLKIRNDVIDQTQKRVWDLQDRLEKNPNDTTVKGDLRELEQKLEQLKQQYAEKVKSCGQ